jgi:hypothetical protein
MLAFTGKSAMRRPDKRHSALASHDQQTELPGWMAAAVLIALSCWMVGVRWHTYFEPLERDIAFYAVAASEVLGGRMLYRDVWANQPPAIHLSYLLVEAVLGTGRLAIFACNLIGAFSVMAGCYYLSLQARISSFGALCAASLWAIVSANVYLEANQPNTELFINAFSLWGAAWLFRGFRAGVVSWTLVISGLLFAMATFYKQIAVVIPAAICGGFVVSDLQREMMLRAILRSLIVGGTIVVSWVILLIVVASFGMWSGFYDAVVVYNHAFTGSITENLISGLAFDHLWPPAMKQMWPLPILSLTAVILAIRKDQWTRLTPFLSYLAGAYIVISMPGRFYPHYYQLLLPVLVMLSAWALAQIPSKWGITTGIVVVAILLAIQLPMLGKDPTEWSRLKYGNVFVDIDSVAKWLNKVMTREELLFQFGSDPEFYFESQRKPASGVLFDYPLIVGPSARGLSLRVVEQLKHTKPEAVVLSRWTLAQITSAHPILQWVSQDYVPAPVGANRDPSFIFVRKNGALQQRLLAQPDASTAQR